MCKILNKKFPHQKHLIEVHNRPYLIDIINQRIKNKLITIFFHNDPQQMKGSKSIRERDKILSVVNKVFCVSEFVKNKFLDGIEDFDNKDSMLSELDLVLPYDIIQEMQIQNKKVHLVGYNSRVHYKVINYNFSREILWTLFIFLIFLMILAR